MFKRFFFFLVLLFSLQNLAALTGGNLYRVMMTRDREPVRLVFVRSLKGVNPELFLMENLRYNGTGIERQADKTIFYEKRDHGRVPVLCFHRIGNDPRYELTVNRTHHLMAFLVKNRFYPVSDLLFADGDFSGIPSGLKPVVIGADDASRGQMIWSEEDLELIASGINVKNPHIDPNCLAAIFSRYFPAVQGHHNLTFYVSFDAVPFRQTGDIPHSGFPYRDLPVVEQKLRYINDNYLLGHHTVTHTYLGDQTPELLIDEIHQAEAILSDYLGQRPNLPTMAYPYGVGSLDPEEETAFRHAADRGVFPEYAYDLDGMLSCLPWSRRFEPFRISRVSVENRSFDTLLDLLESRDIYTSRRTVLLFAQNKNLDLESYHLTIGGDDTVYVYIP